MDYVVGLIFLLLLFFNSYQDFKSRSIYWINIPVIFIFCGSTVSVFDLYFPTIQEVFVNILITSVQIGFLYLISYIRSGNLNVVNKKLGIADILFLVMLTFIFSPVNLILFELVLFTLSLICSMVSAMMKTDGSIATIPLAGNLSLGLALIFVFEYFTQLQIRSSIILEQLFTGLLF